MTVAELVSVLQGYPQDMPVMIEDADTSWDIDIIHTRILDGVVYLFGRYEEMKI